MNRSRRIALALSCTALMVFMVFPHGAAEDTDEEGKKLVHLTNWSIGDHWKWEKRPTPQSKTGTSGNIYATVTGQELARLGMWEEDRHEPWHDKHMSWTVDLWANQTANSPQGPAAIQSKQTRYYKVDDLALVAIDAETRYGFPENPAASYGTESRTENFPPRLEMVFPFAVEDKWRARSYPLTEEKDCDPEERQTPCKSTTNRYHQYEVLRTEPIKLQVDDEYKTFRTYVLLVKNLFRFDDPEYPHETWYDIVWYSPEVCNYVKKETYKSDGTKLYIETLTSYDCAARETGDPSYDRYSYQNFSSTRFHEEGLHLAEDLAQVYERADEGGSSGGTMAGQLWGDLQESPAVSPVVVVSGLLLLAGLVGRRGQRPGRPGT